MGRKVYVAANGEYGCMFDNQVPFTSYKAACDYLIDLFEMNRTRAAGELRRNGLVQCRPRFEGAAYCEVYAVTGTEAEEWREVIG
jgi:hypothetical protein